MAQTGTGEAGTGRNPASRRLRRAIAECLVALLLVALAGFGLAACTFQFGEDTTTSSSAVAGKQSTTTTGGTPITTTATGGSTDTTGATSVITSGDGLASPAQSVGQTLSPSVVNIKVSSNNSQGPFSQEYQAEASGVIYSADGMIITNNHVVTDDYGDRVQTIEVTLATGEKFPARIIGNDPLTDLAVIKISPGLKLPVATFVTEPPNVGEYAIAIGSPLGYENSVTLGIVSGLDRSIENVPGSEGVALNNLIQTDAPISPGNSGGALANASGQVIGINVAYESPTSGAVNIGFAIPAGTVVQVADQLIGSGKATHAYMGVGTLTVTADLQSQFNLSRSSGILVRQVTTGGPADKAGIKTEDIITKIDDEVMKESSDLLVAIRDRKPGDKVQVTVDRDGQEMTFTVTLEERPSGLQ